MVRSMQVHASDLREPLKEISQHKICQGKRRQQSEHINEVRSPIHTNFHHVQVRTDRRQDDGSSRRTWNPYDL